jgi:arylsulfatase A-like enzyme
MFTGRYPSLTGGRDNTARLPAPERHLPGLLSEAGYACGLFGKNHCFADPGAAGFVEVHAEDEVRSRLRAAWGKPYPPPPVPLDPALLAAQPRRFRWGEHPLPIWSGGPHPSRAEDAPARSNVDATLSFLQRHRDRPTFSWLSFFDPHPPFRPPAPFDTRFDPAAMPLPPRRAGELERKPAVQQVYYHGGWHHLMDEAQTRMAAALYYGALAYVDDCLGLVFDALREAGRLDDTIVVVHADHGEFLGEHGLSRKCAAFYDCLVQVPLIVHGVPELGAGWSEAPVELVDLFPTLLQAAGVEAPAHISGRNLIDVEAGRIPAREDSYAEVGSLQPLPAGGPRAALRDALEGLSYDAPLTALPLVESGTFFLSRGRMIRTPEWKYAHYVDDVAELYDLRADPWELENLAGRPEHREQEESLRVRLLERSIEAGDPR